MLGMALGKGESPAEETVHLWMQGITQTHLYLFWAPDMASVRYFAPPMERTV